MATMFPYDRKPVDLWVDRLVFGASDGEYTDAELDETYVERIELWKNTQGPLHEGLVAFIAGGVVKPSPDPTCIFIDRSVQSRNDGPSASSTPCAVSSTAIAHAATSESTQQDSKNVVQSQSVTRTLASDGYRKIADPNKTCIIDGSHSRLLKTATFSTDHRLPFIDLIATASVLTKTQEYYDLLDYQCYWYGGVLFSYSACTLPASSTVVHPLPVGELKKMEAGCYHMGFEIFNVNKAAAGFESLGVLVDAEKSKIKTLTQEACKLRAGRQEGARMALEEAERARGEVLKERAERWKLERRVVELEAAVQAMRVANANGQPQ
ncbi:hypothetical protein BD779DRAFT_1473573 [Infundibulicybe gibba]|nr:hypothetical protein BD779DRAFT_1473573 [Infundibulicybe gibba]